MGGERNQFLHIERSNGIIDLFPLQNRISNFTTLKIVEDNCLEIAIDMLNLQPLFLHNVYFSSGFTANKQHHSTENVTVRNWLITISSLKPFK